MNILVIGRKRNGKGEFSKALTRHLPDSVHVGTSEYLVHRMAVIEGVQEYDILDDKEKYRMALIQLGNDMCDVDPGCLVSIAMWGVKSKHVIVDGVRRICEFEAVKDMFDLVIWVERNGVDDHLDNCELERHHADHVVSNGGDLLDLNNLAAKMVEGIT